MVSPCIGLITKGKGDDPHALFCSALLLQGIGYNSAKYFSLWAFSCHNIYMLNEKDHVTWKKGGGTEFPVLQQEIF